jgi:hypothetical protein
MSPIKRFDDLCDARIEHLKGTVATRATSYVNTDNAADKREAKQAIYELNVWREVHKHYKAVFEIE